MSEGEMKINGVVAELKEFEPKADPELIAAVHNVGEAVKTQSKDLARARASDWAVLILFLVSCGFMYHVYNKVESIESAPKACDANIELKMKVSALTVRVDKLEEQVKAMKKPVGSNVGQQ